MDLAHAALYMEISAPALALVVIPALAWAKKVDRALDELRTAIRANEMAVNTTSEDNKTIISKLVEVLEGQARQSEAIDYLKSSQNQLAQQLGLLRVLPAASADREKS